MKKNSLIVLCVLVSFFVSIMVSVVEGRGASAVSDRSEYSNTSIIFVCVVCLEEFVDEHECEY